MGENNRRATSYWGCRLRVHCLGPPESPQIGKHSGEQVTVARRVVVLVHLGNDFFPYPCRLTFSRRCSRRFTWTAVSPCGRLRECTRPAWTARRRARHPISPSRSRSRLGPQAVTRGWGFQRVADGIRPRQQRSRVGGKGVPGRARGGRGTCRSRSWSGRFQRSRCRRRARARQICRWT